MIALYCVNERTRRLVHDALPGHEQVAGGGDWARFERAAPAAACLVLVLPWLHEPGALPRLAAVRSALPARPLVLVTSRDADNARHLKDAAVDEVVWLGRVRAELPAAVRRARGRELLRESALALERSAGLAPDLRALLARACRGATPVRSVAELAAMMGRDRRTLWRRWNRALLPGPLLRPEDFVHWLVLLHALVRKAPRRSWTDVAADLGVHEHTLGRLAVRLAGAPLARLARLQASAVAEQFLERVLRRLGAEPPRADGTFWDGVRRSAIAPPAAPPTLR